MAESARLPHEPRDLKAVPSTAFARRFTVTLSIIVAIVVVISVIVAWYAVYGNPRHRCVCEGDPCIPVSFSHSYSDERSPGNYTQYWLVYYVSCPFAVSFSSFEALIRMNGTSIGQTTLAANTILSFGPEVKLIVEDLDGDGMMSVGDGFMVYGMGEPHTWVFLLFWTADGSLLNAVSWDTP